MALEDKVVLVLVRLALGDGQELLLEVSRRRFFQRSFEDLAMLGFNRPTMLGGALAQRGNQSFVEVSNE